MMADINQNKTNDAEIAKIKDRVLKASLKKEQAAWEEVLGRESGRRVLWELMKEFGLYKYCFDPNGSKMGENVARQGCAQYIKNRIAFWAGGDYWVKMEQEDMTRNTQDLNEITRMNDELEKKRNPKN
jgi:hypothetical protein